MVGLAVGLGAAGSAAAFVAWFREIRTPRRVLWRKTTVDGVSVAVAHDLVLQHDDGDTVWATRGFAVYVSRGGGAFVRVFRVRPRFGRAWAGYLRSLRARFGYQELVELIPVGDDRFIAFAAGDVHVVDVRAGSSQRTHRLRYFGRGKGRGLMAFGVTDDCRGTIYFGEYTTEPGPHPIGIWRSRDEGRTWHEAFEFPAGEIRHIHAVQFDPYQGGIWVGTGDRDDQCVVGVSHDDAATFRWVARGTQKCRTCGFVFFPDAVLWGMDAGFESNRLIYLRRETGTIDPRAELPGATYYHRKLDERRALLGLAQQVAEVWVATEGGDACRWLSWSMPARPPRGPSPAVRLGRGSPNGATGPFVHVNPIRTAEHGAAIFRIPKTAAPHPPGEAGSASS